MAAGAQNAAGAQWINALLTRRTARLVSVALASETAWSAKALYSSQPVA
jgi:hypothetical protein